VGKEQRGREGLLKRKREGKPADKLLVGEGFDTGTMLRRRSPSITFPSKKDGVVWGRAGRKGGPGLARTQPGFSRFHFLEGRRRDKTGRGKSWRGAGRGDFTLLHHETEVEKLKRKKKKRALRWPEGKPPFPLERRRKKEVSCNDKKPGRP